MSTPIVYLAKQDFKKSFVLDELRKRGVIRTSEGKSIESEDYLVGRTCKSKGY